MNKRIELGCAGHFVGAKDCYWRRHTQVGRFRISTVGNYFPLRDKPRHALGYPEDTFFETMVFETTAGHTAMSESCGCRTIKDWNGIEQKRYATAGAAQAGHERMVAKYQRRTK